MASNKRRNRQKKIHFIVADERPIKPPEHLLEDDRAFVSSSTVARLARRRKLIYTTKH